MTNSFFPPSLFQSNQIPYQPENNQSKSLESSPQPLPDFAQNASSALREKGMPGNGRKKNPTNYFLASKEEISVIYHCCFS